MGNRIEWLVFDLGGVLVDVAPQNHVLAEWAHLTDTDEVRLASLLREQFTEQPFSLAERFQIGALDAHGFHAALNRELGRPLAFDTLIDGLESVLVGEKTETVRLLAELASRYKTACYSNTNVTHWRYLHRHYGFFRHMDRAFASQEIGFAKPDHRGFEKVAGALAALPEQCLLIDDRPVNVEGARRAGWQALQFVDVDTLVADMDALSIAVRGKT